MKKYEKVYSLIPFLIMLYVIFLFSAQDGDASSELSSEVGYGIIDFVVEVFHLDISTEAINQILEVIHTPLRKCAHVTEYFILTLCAYYPVYVYGFRNKRLYGLTAIVSVAVACLDEIHQLFVADRSGSPKDVGIDSIGIFSCLLVIWICMLVRGRGSDKSRATKSGS